MPPQEATDDHIVAEVRKWANLVNRFPESQGSTTMYIGGRYLLVSVQDSALNKFKGD